MKDDRSLKAITMQKIDGVENSDALSVKANGPGFERKQLRRGAESERNDIMHEAAGGTSEVKISKNYAYRNTIDPKINIHFAFIYGLLKTFGNPTQYQIIVDGEQCKSVASKKLTSFDEVIEYHFSGKIQDYKKVLKEKPEEVKKRIADIYNSGYADTWSPSDEVMYGVYTRNPDVIFDELMKRIFVNLRDRKFDNVMLNNINKKPRLVDIDLFFEEGYGNVFLFDKMDEYSVMSLSNYIDKQSNKEQKKKYYDTLQKYIDKYTLDQDKISKLIQNTTEFAFGLELTAEDVINSTYNYLQHGLSETKKKIEYIKWLKDGTYNKDVFNEKEKLQLNDKYKKDMPLNIPVMGMLLKSFNKQKEAMEQFLKNEKECKEQIGKIVNEYYKLHGIIDNVDRTSLEIAQEGGTKNVIREEKKKQEKIKDNITSLINIGLCKGPKDKQKKLFWERAYDGGKLMNERWFFGCKSGYIKKINRECYRLFGDKTIDHTTQLENLELFVKELNEKEMNCRCF